jgi:hypothetical protein
LGDGVFILLGRDWIGMGWKKKGVPVLVKKRNTAIDMNQY